MRDIITITGILSLAAGLAMYDWRVSAVVIGALFIVGGVYGHVRS